MAAIANSKSHFAKNVDSRRAPWDAKPYQLFSWWDMEQFSADRFYHLAGMLRVLIEVTENKEVTAQNLNRDVYEKFLDSVTEDCRAIGLRTAIRAVANAKSCFVNAKPNDDLALFRATLVQVENVIEWEMKDHLFMHIPSDRAKWYSSPLYEWNEVVGRFPKVRFDIEESSRCYACDRYGAAIFHILLVAEYGVVEVAKLLEVAGDKPGWGSLDKLEQIIKKPYPERSLLHQRHCELLKNILPLTHAIKDSWRHKISHIENKLEWLDTDFSPQMAAEIILATRGFMRRLSTGLPALDQAASAVSSSQ